MSDPAPTVDDAVDGLARIVDEAVRLLGQAGEVDSACRLAARAWWLADARAPLAARRLSATLHRLTRVYEKGEHAWPTPPTRPSTSAASRPRTGTA